MSIKFLDEGTIKENIFIQETEPEEEKGIWIKSNSLSDYDIVEVDGMSSLVSNSINIVKGNKYEAIILNSNIINDLHYKFEGIYITDDNKNIDYNTNIYVKNTNEWTDITPSSGHIYGIKRYMDSSSSQWARTDDATELIANATKDGGIVQNDFDNISPWKNIITYNYNILTESIVAYYGDDNFTFTPTEDNIVVLTQIPTFWYKREQKDDGYEYIQIADYAANGFDEFMGCSIGRYTLSGSNSNPTIKSGVNSLVDISISNSRNTAESMGINFHLLDWKTWGALQILYLVEYANYNSQEMLGKGITSGSKQVTLGGCDSLGMKSGCINNDGNHSVAYRGIENPFGNINQWLDGINFKGIQGYISNNPSKYESNVFSENYQQLSYACNCETYASKIGYDSNYPLAMFAIDDTNASNNSYITDFQYYKSGNDNLVACIGAFWNNKNDAGFFYTDVSRLSSFTSSYHGVRVFKIDS